jgi:hypothetical protein
MTIILIYIQGVRFQTRGLDDDGHVANYVEVS